MPPTHAPKIYAPSRVRQSLMRQSLMRPGERLSPLQRCHLRVSLAVEDPPARGILRDYGMLRARGTPWARGTSPCAPGAFSLTAMVFRSPRAQKGAWCARRWSGARLSDRSRRGRKATTTGMEESRERPRDGAEGRGGKKEVKGRKSLKKVLQYG